MSPLARSCEGVLARAKAASGKKPERDECTLERMVRGSSEATYGKHAFLVPRSSERVFARVRFAVPDFYKYGFLSDFSITSLDLLLGF